MAYAATARTREFGVRVALGATPGAIGGLVLRDAARITVVGIAVGLGLTLALGKFAESLLVAVTPGDPRALGAAVGVVAVVALGAAFVPAWRSSRVQPTERAAGRVIRHPAPGTQALAPHRHRAPGTRHYHPAISPTAAINRSTSSSVV